MTLCSLNAAAQHHLCQSRCCQLVPHISGFPPPHGSCQTTVLGPAFPFPHLQILLQKLFFFCHLLFQPHLSIFESQVLSFSNYPHQKGLGLKLFQLEISPEKNENKKTLYFSQEGLTGGNSLAVNVALNTTLHNKVDSLHVVPTNG